MSVQVAVVVCVLNGGRDLVRCLASLGTQTLDRSLYEVVVVDDGSTDGTPEILRTSDVPNQVVTFERNRGLSVARNAGLSATTAAIVCFTDADCEATPSWLAHVLAGFEEWPDAGAIGGAVVSAKPTTAVEHWYAYTPGTSGCHQPLGDARPRLARLLRLVRGRVPSHGELLAVVQGANSAFRREVLLQVQGWNPEIRFGGDDVDLGHRLQAAGVTQRYSDAAVIVHHHRSRVRQFLRHAFLYGRGNGRLARIEGRSPIRLAAEEPTALAVFAIFAAALRSPFPLAAPALLFGIAAAPAAWRYARDHGRPLLAVQLLSADVGWRAAHWAGRAAAVVEGRARWP